MRGQIYRLDELSGGAEYRYDDGTVTIVVDANDSIILEEGSAIPGTHHLVDMGRYHTLVTLLRGITDASFVHQVNTRLLAEG